ncbi:acyl-CoA synthetase, partial [Mycobacterium avium subsp. hominissuis]
MTSEATPSATAAGPRLADLVEAAAQRAPRAPALLVASQRTPIAYADLVRLVDDLAARLRAAGLGPGDRVGLRAGSNPEFVVALLAASRADLVVAPLDPALPAADQLSR